MLPPQATPFLLTLAISTLIGIGLRDYYEQEGKRDTFGTVRTFIFLGLLGHMLYRIPVIGAYAFLVGMVVVGPFLLVYYNNKVAQQKSPGLIGVLIALLTYSVGPVVIHEPHWYLVAFAITILFVLHSKGRIRQFTDRLETGEVVTACKFLAIAGVILPLIPAVPPTDGWVGRLFSILPVGPHQIWMAVVVTTAISYFGYVLQTYLYPKKGLLLTGLIGGLYSSTMTVLVISKKTRTHDDQAREAAAAIPDVEVAGHPDDRLPHIVTFSALYVDGETIVGELDRLGLSVASGSACTASTLEPSHVLAAMGLLTHGNVRITLPWAAMAPDRAAAIDRLIEALPGVIAAARARLGADGL